MYGQHTNFPEIYKPVIPEGNEEEVKKDVDEESNRTHYSKEKDLNLTIRKLD